jgi:Tfp pilus assembly protein PilV
MTKTARHQACGQTSGFSTLESLAALLVLNLLLISLFSSQLLAWQAQRETLAADNTVELAQDLWHRMQLNSEGLSSYQMGWEDKPITQDCLSKACNANDWAKADLADWHIALQQRMPGAKAKLLTQTTFPAYVDLILAWPSTSLITTADDTPADCPAQHRCWQTRWQP